MRVRVEVDSSSSCFLGAVEESTGVESDQAALHELRLSPRPARGHDASTRVRQKHRVSGAENVALSESLIDPGSNLRAVRAELGCVSGQEPWLGLG